MRRPVQAPFAITTEFGVKDSAAKFGKHSGVDYGVPTGTPVYAPVAGTVTTYVWGQYHGNVVQIKDASGRYHRLMHNSQLLVKPGQKVGEGQLVAKSGATGQGVTGPHVHYDISTEANPSAFKTFISPASLLFPPATPTAPRPLQSFITLPKSAGTWAAYRVGSGMRKGTSDQVGTLLPGQYGDLTYPIKGTVPNGVIIDTQSYGRVQVWTTGTSARIFKV
jgi:murein DD-endopeptidase MepM/ murein hydrolase activator NlpD